MNRNEFDAFIRQARSLFPRVSRYLSGRMGVQEVWYRVLAPVAYEDACEALEAMVRDSSLLPDSTEAFPSTVLSLASKSGSLRSHTCSVCGGTGFVPACDPLVAEVMVAHICNCAAGDTVRRIIDQLEESK